SSVAAGRRSPRAIRAARANQDLRVAPDALHQEPVQGRRQARLATYCGHEAWGFPFALDAAGEAEDPAGLIRMLPREAEKNDFDYAGRPTPAPRCWQAPNAARR